MAILQITSGHRVPGEVVQTLTTIKQPTCRNNIQTS
uniref:Uncharacterized protein n=1 Tax=Arundo donax TaxID=35708 RepID=A0A0A9C661_ARUDO